MLSVCKEKARDQWQIDRNKIFKTKTTKTKLPLEERKTLTMQIIHRWYKEGEGNIPRISKRLKKKKDRRKSNTYGGQNTVM